jgi:hypothetical protein
MRSQKTSWKEEGQGVRAVGTLRVMGGGRVEWEQTMNVARLWKSLRIKARGGYRSFLPRECHLQGFEWG